MWRRWSSWKTGSPNAPTTGGFKVRHQDGQTGLAALDEVLTRRLSQLPRGTRSGRPELREAVRVPAEPAPRRRGPRPLSVACPGPRGAPASSAGHLGRRAPQALRGGPPAGARRAGCVSPRLPSPVPAPNRSQTRRIPITYHRRLREQHATPQSVLDDVPGLGPTPRLRSSKEFRVDVAAPGRHRDGAGGVVVAPSRSPAPCLSGLHEVSVSGPPLNLLIITGLSGAGASWPRTCSDLRFFVIDNLPPSLIPQGRGAWPGTGAAVPVRAGCRLPPAFVDDLNAALAEVRETGARTSVLFLDITIRCWSDASEASRRPHPVAGNDRISDGIRQGEACSEGSKAKPISSSTPRTSTYTSCDRLHELFRPDAQSPPGRRRPASCRSALQAAASPDVDLVFDCRFLPNPHWGRLACGRCPAPTRRSAAT